MLKKLINLPQNSPEMFGIILRIGSGIFFAVMVGLIKLLGNQLSLSQMIFFRSLFAIIPLVIFLQFTSNFPKGLATKHPFKHLARCTFGIVGMFCSFASLKYLPIAEATVISFLSPVVLVVLSVFVLKETVNQRRWLGVFLGILGLLIMSLPNFSADLNKDTLLGLFFGVMFAILAAMAMLQVRQLSQMGEDSGAIAFYFAITGVLVGGVLMLSHWITPTLIQWLFLVFIGLTGGVAQILMTLSFKYAEASAMAAYEYLYVVWTVLIGVLFFDEIPSVYFWLALPVIILGAIIAKPRKR